MWLYDKITMTRNTWTGNTEVYASFILGDEASVMGEKISLSVGVLYPREQAESFEKAKELLEKRVNEVTGLTVLWVRNLEPGV